MAEPRSRAGEIERLLPWLWHWGIEDDRLGGYRSDSYALRTLDGLVVIDALPLSSAAKAELEDVCAIVMTHANHQRATWRFRRELGAPVFVPADAEGLDEEPDGRIEDGATLPGGLHAMEAQGFAEACYLTYTPKEGPSVLFCGDLICHEPGEPYRFPVQPDYFDPVGGREDARRLLELRLDALCAAHAEPTLTGCGAALRGALEGEA